MCESFLLKIIQFRVLDLVVNCHQDTLYDILKLAQSRTGLLMRSQSIFVLIVLLTGTLVPIGFSHGQETVDKGNDVDISIFVREAVSLFKQQRDDTLNAIKECRENVKNASPEERQQVREDCKTSLNAIREMYKDVREQMRELFKEYRENVKTLIKEAKANVAEKKMKVDDEDEAEDDAEDEAEEDES